MLVSCYHHKLNWTRVTKSRWQSVCSIFCVTLSVKLDSKFVSYSFLSKRTGLNANAKWRKKMWYINAYLLALELVHFIPMLLLQLLSSLLPLLEKVKRLNGSSWSLAYFFVVIAILKWRPLFHIIVSQVGSNKNLSLYLANSYRLILNLGSALRYLVNETL